MPDAALSAALAEAYASAPTDALVLHTLELRHPAFATPSRVVNDHADLVATLEASAPVDALSAVTFIHFAFRFRLPDVQCTGLPTLEIEIDNVSGEILAYMDQAANSDSPVELTYRPYLSGDLGAPAMDPPITLILRDVEADAFAVRAQAGFGDYANRRFPGQWYDAERFPGLLA